MLGDLTFENVKSDKTSDNKTSDNITSYNVKNIFESDSC